MTSSIKRVAVALFFAAQLLFVWMMSRPAQAGEQLSVEESVKRYGFALRDVAKECGIDFNHESPAKLDKKLDHIMPIIASMGAGVSIVDFDRDGWDDIYVVTSIEGGKNRLYRNLGNGKFEDAAEALGVADLNRDGTGVCQGAVWGDFDNDGFDDLLVYKWGKPQLFRNDKGKGFTDVTAESGLPAWSNANSAVWFDFDRDGRLDMFIAGYWADDVDLWKLRDTKIMPTSFEFAQNGGRKYLLRNKGDGSFEDVTAKMGITSTRWTLAVVAADLCGSGYPDLVLANDYGVSEVYRNVEGKGFVEVGDKNNLGEKPKSGMSVSAGDVYNHGRLSLYVSNISAPGNLVQGNNLWIPGAHKPGIMPKYIEEAANLKVALGGWAWGAQFGDLNNDGTQDLYLTNGYISADKTANYWYEYGNIAGAVKDIINDAKNWPAMRGRSLAGYENKCLWWNKGGGTFVDVARAAGVTDTYDGRAVAMADLWNRGVLDVVVANQNGPLLVYKNNVPKSRAWVQLDLRPKGLDRAAVGATVTAYWADAAGAEQRQVQALAAGSGYAAQNMRRLHFGLGEEPTMRKIVVRWPSGQSQELTGLAINRLHTIQEP